MAKIIGNTVGVPNPKSDLAQTDPTKADFVKNKKVSLLENDAGYAKEKNIPTKLSDLEDDSFSKPINQSEWANHASMDDDGNILWVHYATKDELDPWLGTFSTADINYQFNYSIHHQEIRCGELASISFTFNNGAYPDAYISSLVFDSGEIPTSIDYTDSGILNWVGVDCTMVDGFSIFQPSANTHYDIIFYFNGSQFIGLVNGFVPSKRNVVSE